MTSRTKIKIPRRMPESAQERSALIDAILASFAHDAPPLPPKPKASQPPKSKGGRPRKSFLPSPDEVVDNILTAIRSSRDGIPAYLAIDANGDEYTVSVDCDDPDDVHAYDLDRIETAMAHRGFAIVSRFRSSRAMRLQIQHIEQGREATDAIRAVASLARAMGLKMRYVKSTGVTGKGMTTSGKK